MLVDTWSDYLEEFLLFIKPVSGLVSDFFTNLFTNIPELEKLFLIATGVGFMLIGIYLFYRLLSD